MKNVRSIFLAVALLSPVAPAMAETNAPAASQEEVSEVQVTKALETLVKAGVIKIENGQIVVKAPSVLEQLSQGGRLRVESASYGSICF